MCRNIKSLFNFDPPATEEEIQDAALQFVRKISGFAKPSERNKAAFNQAVNNITTDATLLLDSLVTNSEPRNRAVETQKAKARSMKRFGPKE